MGSNELHRVSSYRLAGRRDGRIVTEKNDWEQEDDDGRNGWIPEKIGRQPMNVATSLELGLLLRGPARVTGESSSRASTSQGSPSSGSCPSRCSPSASSSATASFLSSRPPSFGSWAAAIWFTRLVSSLASWCLRLLARSWKAFCPIWLFRGDEATTARPWHRGSRWKSRSAAILAKPTPASKNLQAVCKMPGHDWRVS